MLERHKKHLAVTRGWLNGKGYHKAAQALELVRKLETGFRKDGLTPAFHHQLSVARLVMTLSDHLLYPEETITAAFLHDLLEDHSDIYTKQDVENLFGVRVANAVWALTKKSRGIVKEYEIYFGDMENDEIASIVKLADRAHNIQTMNGVFTNEKQKKYVSEVDTWFFPMGKAARRNFPRQLMAYENLKILLRCQCKLVNIYLGVKPAEPPKINLHKQRGNYAT
jgi:(p)ppGpp synthase/HD superfamily hydrolase